MINLPHEENVQPDFERERNEMISHFLPENDILQIDDFDDFNTSNFGADINKAHNESS